MAVDDYSATITDMIRGARPADMSLKRVSDPRNGGMRPVRSGFDAKLAQAQPAEFDSQKLADAGYGGRPSQPTITQDDRARYSAETFRPAARKGAFEHGSSVAMASREAGAAPAGGSAVEAANVAARMLEVEQQFQGVQSRHYGPQDLVWNGPSPSLGNMKGTGASVIRNPITGGPMVTQPGQTPQMFLRALNQMARAKAEAQANVIRGADSDRAFARAMEQAFGVPEGVLQGLSPDQARSVGEQMQQTNAAGARDLERQQAESREAQDYDALRTGMAQQDPAAAAVAGQAATPGMASTIFGGLSRANEAAQQETEQGALAQIANELDQLPPEEAARTALQRIMATGVFKANSSRPIEIAQHYAQRAQGMAKQAKDEQVAADRQAVNDKRDADLHKRQTDAIAKDAHAAIATKVAGALASIMEIRGTETGERDPAKDRMAKMQGRNQMAAKRIAKDQALLKARAALSRYISKQEFDAAVQEAEVEASPDGMVDVDAGPDLEAEDRSLDDFASILTEKLSEAVWSKVGG